MVPDISWFDPGTDVVDAGNELAGRDFHAVGQCLDGVGELV